MVIPAGEFMKPPAFFISSYPAEDKGDNMARKTSNSRFYIFCRQSFNSA